MPKTRSGAAPTRRAGSPAGAPNAVRIIGGRWKRSILPVPDAPGLRPTPDRVRETLFNWLGQRLDGLACVDLFAGTGALGFEAASRGAAQVLMLERDARAAASLSACAQRLGASQVSVHRGDAIAWLARAQDAAPRARFDLVFLDPPFGEGLLGAVLPALAPVLAPAARLYVEAEAPFDPSPWPLRLLRQSRAGQVHYHLLEWTGP
ncbi:MAG: 16S rRNA (guanine(966)-N(2))-methyltransferase RsmD [Lautropia sp.]